MQKQSNPAGFVQPTTFLFKIKEQQAQQPMLPLVNAPTHSSLNTQARISLNNPSELDANTQTNYLINALSSSNNNNKENNQLTKSFNASRHKTQSDIPVQYTLLMKTLNKEKTSIHIRENIAPPFVRTNTYITSRDLLNQFSKITK